MDAVIQTNAGLLGLDYIKTYYRWLNTSLEVWQFLVQASSDSIISKFLYNKLKQLEDS